MRVAPICVGCTHLQSLADSSCDAFPYGIPDPIILSEADHRKPYESDRGITFDPRTPEDARFAADVFDSPKATKAATATEHLVGQVVLATEFVSPDSDRKPRILTGVLESRYVPGLDYDRLTVDGIAVRPETVVPVPAKD